MASSSKYPAAVAIAGAVADGYLKFDTKVNEVFSWWTKDPNDKRSYVTLRSLLNFASGLVCETHNCGAVCITGRSVLYSSEECAEQIYKAGYTPGDAWKAYPGELWSYHSAHLQLAGAMAAKATQLPLNDLVKKYLLEKVPMPNSYWQMTPGYKDTPVLAEEFISTGDDYDKLLQASLTYKILPKEVMDQMETDAFKHWPKLQFSTLDKDKDLRYYGHYSMGTYFECVGYSDGWSPECAKKAVHADPGAFGYWPLIHRSKGYYMNIVTERQVTFPDWYMQQNHIRSDTLGSLPGHCIAPLRFDIETPVEKALFGSQLTLGKKQGRKLGGDPRDPLCSAAIQYDPYASAGFGPTKPKNQARI